MIRYGTILEYLFNVRSKLTSSLAGIGRLRSRSFSVYSNTIERYHKIVGYTSVALSPLWHETVIRTEYWQ